MTSNYIPMGSDGSSLNNIDINVLNTHFLNENGDAMRGTLGMNNYQIKNVGEGIDEKDVINKKQMDNLQSSLKSSSWIGRFWNRAFLEHDSYPPPQDESSNVYSDSSNVYSDSSNGYYDVIERLL